MFARLVPTAAAAFFTVTVAPAHAACDDIVRLSLAPFETSDGTCDWRTPEPWTAPEACGAFAFQVAGTGDAPGSVVFKRRNTAYSSTWTPAAPSSEDGAAWIAGSLDDEDLKNRCAVGWCEPTRYALTTGSPADPALCAQDVELRIRLTDTPPD